MQKILLFITALVFALVAKAEPINIYYTVGVGPNFGLIPSLVATLEHANANQTKYKFILDFKPGANGLLAVKTLDKEANNRIVGVGPHFLGHVRNGVISLKDYAAVEETGYDICTGVITNVGSTSKGLDSLEAYRGKEITVGTLSPASPAYTTAVELSKRYGFIPKFVAFKSDDEGFLAIVGNHGINFAFSPPKKYHQYLSENPNLQLLAVHCPSRIATVPNVKTLAEYQIHVPPIFNLVLAKSSMPAQQRQEIGKILAASEDATNIWTSIPHLRKPYSASWHGTRLQEQHDFLSGTKLALNGKQ
jgi:tripartite-type tricarboxylate transporter receptor subunit TctC